MTSSRNMHWVQSVHKAQTGLVGSHVPELLTLVFPVIVLAPKSTELREEGLVSASTLTCPKSPSAPIPTHPCGSQSSDYRLC